MATATKTNRSTIQSRDAQVIAGIKKRLQSVPAFVLGGVSYTPATLVALIQSQLDAITAVAAATAQRANAILAYKAVSLTVNNAMLGLRDIVRQMFNNAPDAVADFGFTPKKTTKRSPVTNVVAAARVRATREARGTRSAKAKLAIKGAAAASDIVATVTAHMEPNAPAPGGTAPGVASGEAPPSPAPAPVPAAPVQAQGVDKPASK